MLLDRPIVHSTLVIMPDLSLSMPASFSAMEIILHLRLYIFVVPFVYVHYFEVSSD